MASIEIYAYYFLLLNIAVFFWGVLFVLCQMTSRPTLTFDDLQLAPPLTNITPRILMTIAHACYCHCKWRHLLLFNGVHDTGTFTKELTPSQVNIEESIYNLY